MDCCKKCLNCDCCKKCLNCDCCKKCLNCDCCKECLTCDCCSGSGPGLRFSTLLREGWKAAAAEECRTKIAENVKQVDAKMVSLRKADAGHNKLQTSIVILLDHIKDLKERVKTYVTESAADEELAPEIWSEEVNKGGGEVGASLDRQRNHR